MELTGVVRCEDCRYAERFTADTVICYVGTRMAMENPGEKIPNETHWLNGKEVSGGWYCPCGIERDG